MKAIQTGIEQNRECYRVTYSTPISRTAKLRVFADNAAAAIATVNQFEIPTNVGKVEVWRDRKWRAV